VSSDPAEPTDLPPGAGAFAVGPAADGALADPAAPPAGDEVFPLHPKAPLTWLLQSAVALAVPALPVALTALFSGSWILAGAVPVVVLAVLGASAAYGRAAFRRFRCRLLPDGLLIERGVWWRSETFVPRARIQHTDVEEGPLQRHLGMATLEVYTAGTHVSKLAVHGLARDSALRLRDLLLGRGGDDAL
jgi:membrane protein YdbS with pleckstrin-like domain